MTSRQRGVRRRPVQGGARRVREFLARRQVADLVADMAGVGHGVSISGRPVISSPSKVTLGDNVHIGTGAFIRAGGGLTIGANTHISRNLVLYTEDHDYKGDRLPYDSGTVRRGVEIGRNVWIGMNVCICPGTTIGDGAIVGMGTVVSGQVPPLAIVASQAWRVIGHRDAEHYTELDSNGRYGASGGRPYVPEAEL